MLVAASARSCKALDRPVHSTNAFQETFMRRVKPNGRCRTLATSLQSRRQGIAALTSSGWRAGNPCCLEDAGSSRPRSARTVRAAGCRGAVRPPAHHCPSVSAGPACGRLSRMSRRLRPNADTRVSGTSSRVRTVANSEKVGHVRLQHHARPSSSGRSPERTQLQEKPHDQRL